MSSVSNPYTFNISSNCKLEANINLAVPEVDTILLSGDSENWQNQTVDITIPVGIHVLKIYAYATAMSEVDYCSATVWIYTFATGTNKTWVSASSAPDWGSNKTDRDNQYIGVTPGKTYSVRIVCDAEKNGGDGYSKFCIWISKSINNQKPTVEDY